MDLALIAPIKMNGLFPLCTVQVQCTSRDSNYSRFDIRTKSQATRRKNEEKF